MDREQIFRLTVNELKDKLSGLNLSTTGRKATLQDRLCEHFGLTVGDDDGSSDESVSVHSFVIPANGGGRPVFSLRDIENSLLTFSGSGHPSIEEWLEVFESNALAVQWDQLQMFIYGKQLLKGAAHLFVRSQRSISSWSSLKQSLKSEFGTIMPSVEVHRLLRNRRKRSNEDYREYLYTLMEIGKSINLDDKSLIEYFVEGIPDSRSNKSNLYQARSVEELKNQILIYEKVRSGRQPVSNPVRIGEVTNKDNVDNRSPKRCYKCGTIGHLAPNCPRLKSVCYGCGQSGHRVAQCPKNSVQVKQERPNMNTLGARQQAKSMGCVIFKDLSHNYFTFSALLDTGCDLCLMRYDVLMMMGEVKLSDERHELIGIGNSGLSTLGSFILNMSVDGIELNIKFHVVRERDIVYQAIIGNDVLRQVNLVVTEDEVMFTKKVKRDSSEDKEIVVSNDTITEFKSLCFISNPIDKDKVEVELTHLSKIQEKEVENLIRNYSPKMKHISPVEMKICLLDDIPVYQPPRRMSYANRIIVNNQVSEWLREGIIQPSKSEYSSPIVLVKKKDSSYRLCCDYRRINEKIIKDNFPMPLIDDVIERLQSARVYTTIDLRNGFFHVPIEANSTKYTSFVTHQGQYEFRYVPFGICNSPAVFTRYIFAVFRDFVENETVITYMDDLIIPSRNTEEGIVKLRMVLNRAAEYNLKIKWEKCHFLKSRVEFLGYIVENGTIKPSQAKTDAVERFPLPKDRKSVQRYLGLTSYFRRFISGYAVVAKPLSDLLRQGKKFEFGAEQLLAFEQLKAALVKAPVLRLYNPKAMTEVHTDASMFGYGAVLLQKDSEDQHYHPVQYMSRKTTESEERYHSYELEVLAIIAALKKWRVYLLGIQFKIVTDCNAFAMTMRKKEIPLRISRWALFLQDYKYTIEHRSGTRMRHVDALSRVSCLLLEDSLRHRLQMAQAQDDWTRVVIKLQGKDAYEDFYVKHGVLYKNPTKELVVVPSLMEEEVIRIAHNQGHFSSKRTQEVVEKTFYIPHIAEKVKRVVTSCIQCIISDSKVGKKEGFLEPIDKEDRPLGTFHIDHVGPMEKTNKRYSYIFVVIDAFSKFVWLYPTRSTGTEEVVDRLKKQSFIFGHPKRIISDRGVAFTSNSFGDYCKDNGILHLLIATGVPRGNGQVERVHKIVMPMLAKLCSENPSGWYKYVDQVQQTLNNTPPRSTKISPFKLLTGVDMRVSQLQELNEFLDKEAIEEFTNSRENLRREAQENIATIQKEYKKNFDSKRKKATVYELNQLVAIKRTQFGSSLRLRPKFLVHIR
ncbi:unnamed protein product [Ceratitis capitata]|uniref:RNA-directed DNA polymerase n=1 Tax=Ceratitis capitata TaxID=7213 RepID=A0A811UPK1_CERCA|nr:unnamed protein product [Ceratitis capitata]